MESLLLKWQVADGLKTLTESILDYRLDSVISSKQLVLMLVISVTISSVTSANIAKFLERDLMIQNVNADKRNNVIEPASKRTETAEPLDIPNTNLETPDTVAETPEINYTSDSKTDTPNTPNTPDTELLYQPSGSGESGEGSGNTDSSGDAKIGLAENKVILQQATNPGSYITTQNGQIKVTWTPHTQLTNVTKIKLKKNRNLVKDSESPAARKAVITNSHTESGPLLERRAILNSFFKVGGHLKYRRGLSGYSKKSKISKIKKSKASKEESPGRSFKKQFLGLPNQGTKEGLGGEPVGDLNAEGGLGGLGGDMEGIPTGMGAGAEPLGAYEPGNGPPPHNIEGPGGDPRNLEEEFGGPPPGLSKGPGPGSDEGDLVVPHGPPGGFDGPPPAGLHFSKDEPGAERGPFDETMEPPPPDMTNSMTNNIGAMDKANIQGDSDVAEMVRKYAKGKDDFGGNPFDTSPTGQKSTPLNKDFMENEFEPNHLNGERAIKRRLLKTKGRKKWKKFKNLQKKHE